MKIDRLLYTQRRMTDSATFFALTIFFLLLLSINAGAQSGNSSRIDRLKGGNIGLNFKWSGEGFSGLGARADAMGGSISTLFSDAQSISVNPAGLGFARGFSVVFDWSPPLTVDPSILTRAIGVGKIDERINDELFETAQKNSPGGVVLPGTYEDADVRSSLDMRGGLKGGALMYGNPVFAVAVSFHQPFRIESQLNMSSLELLAATLDEDGDATYRVFGTVNGNSSMNLTIESSTIAAGTRLLPNLSAGIAYDNFSSDMNFQSTFLPEGIISGAAGDPRSFNDPARIQYDSLFATLRGDWDGNASRFRWGVGYHPIPNISLDATLSMPLKMSLSGPFSMIHNNIRALDIGSSDILIEETLLEDNFTKTEKKITQIPGMDLEIPGSWSAGFSARWENYLASIVYTRYFNDLGYNFTYQQFDSLLVEKKSGQIKQGVDFGNAVRLAIGVRPMLLGLGIVTGETFSRHDKNTESDGEEDRNRILLPVLSLGGGINLSSHFKIDYVLSFYNSSFLRFSTTYRL